MLRGGVCALAAVVALGAAPAVARADVGYTTIFDGSATGSDASFDKWAQSGPGGFTLQPDGSIRSFGGLGMRWYTLKQYGDISLKVDYRDSRTAPGYSNGGVMVRSPDPVAPLSTFPTTWTYDWAGLPGPWPPAKHYESNPASTRSGDRTACTNVRPTLLEWRVVECGEEIQVNDSPDGGTIDPKKTGSVYNFADLDAIQSNAVERYPQLGVWHTMEVRLVGHQYTILVDGKLINQFDESIPQITVRSFDSPTMARELLKGYIGVQNHDATDVLDYGNIRVKELAAPPKNTTAPAISGDGFTGHPLQLLDGCVDQRRSQPVLHDRLVPLDPGHQGRARGDRLRNRQGRQRCELHPGGGRLRPGRLVPRHRHQRRGRNRLGLRRGPGDHLGHRRHRRRGGSVPATLSLTLGVPASFGPFTAGVAKDYTASTTANVISTAGDATLSVADPSTTATGHLVNGAFSLPQPLQARARNAANTGTAFNNVGSGASPLNLLMYNGPVSNDAVSLDFKQSIGSADALRTGTYSKSLTFTLSTTTP